MNFSTCALADFAGLEAALPLAKLVSPKAKLPTAKAAKSKSSIWPEPSAPGGADNFAKGEVTLNQDSRRGTLEVNQEICKRCTAEKAPPDVPPNKSAVP